MPACAGVALGGLCLPALVVPVPPLLDYPNHLARLWLLAGGGASGPLRSAYGFDWTGAFTNAGTDLVAVALGPLVGPGVLPPLFLMLACLLPPLGAVLLNRALFGGWHWWQCGFGVLAWGFTLLAGFLNFQLSLGLALLAGAAHGMIRPAFRAVTGAVILVCHPFGCLFYGVITAALAFGPAPGVSVRRVWQGLAQGAAACLVPFALFWAALPALPGSHAALPMYQRWGGDVFANKLLTAASLVITYDAAIDFAFLIALWAVLRVVIGMRAGLVHAGLLYAAPALAGLAVVLPAALANTAYIDIRFPVMAALLAASGLRPASRLAPTASAAALTLLVLARTGWIGAVWDARQADMRSLARALAAVPPGAAILPAEHCCAPGPVGRRLLVTTPTTLHDPALAVPWRQAFVPTLFAAPGKQPLRVLPPWDTLAVPEGRTAPVSLLDTWAPSPANRFFFGYLEQWRERFGYVLVVNADTANDGPDDTSVPGLVLLADEGFARLYRIRQP